MEQKSWIKSHLWVVIVAVIAVAVIVVIAVSTNTGKDNEKETKPANGEVTSEETTADEENTEENTPEVEETTELVTPEEITTGEEGTTVPPTVDSGAADDTREDPELATEPDTEPVTEPATEKETEKVTEPAMENTTVKPSETPTQKPTVTPTQPATEKQTEKVTQPVVKTDEQKFKEAGGTYMANSDGTITITGGNLTGNVVIPSSIDGKKVTAVAEEAFLNNMGLTSVTINSEVIENYAFWGCDNLESVVIGPEVREIGISAFNGCDNLVSVTFNNNRITEIKAQTFDGCKKLTSLTIPASINRLAANFLQQPSTYYVPGGTEMVYDIPPFTLTVLAPKGSIEVYFDLWGEHMELGTDLDTLMNKSPGRTNVTVVYK